MSHVTQHQQLQNGSITLAMVDNNEVDLIVLGSWPKAAVIIKPGQHSIQTTFLCWDGKCLSVVKEIPGWVISPIELKDMKNKMETASIDACDSLLYEAFKA